MTDHVKTTTAGDLLDQDGDTLVLWWFKLWLANWSTLQAKSHEMEGRNLDHVFTINFIVPPLSSLALGIDANSLRIAAKIGNRDSRVERRSARGRTSP